MNGQVAEYARWALAHPLDAPRSDTANAFERRLAQWLARENHGQRATTVTRPPSPATPVTATATATVTE